MSSLDPNPTFNAYARAEQAATDSPYLRCIRARKQRPCAATDPYPTSDAYARAEPTEPAHLDANPTSDAYARAEPTEPAHLDNIETQVFVDSS